MEKAIADGDIAWHGLPFTTHTELMDQTMFRSGLGLSKILDQRFGKKTIAAKMTDVPGHTRSMVPFLAEAGIRFLHIGVNPACPSPEVPSVFRWRHEDSKSEIIVMYNTGGYGATQGINGVEDILSFAHTGDNNGPQDPESIVKEFEKAREAFPDYEVKASTLDAFACEISKHDLPLPVIVSEIGDTWIHGVGTDPRKVAAYRALLRLRGMWLKDRQLDVVEREAISKLDRDLLPVAEHTWGLNVNAHLRDYENYSVENLHHVRKTRKFKRMEESWNEQRGYIRDAIKNFRPGRLKKEMREMMGTLEPEFPRLKGWDRITDTGRIFHLKYFNFQFDVRIRGPEEYLRRGESSWRCSTIRRALA